MTDRAEEIAGEIVHAYHSARVTPFNLTAAIADALRASEERARKAKARISVSGYVPLSEFDAAEARANAAEARVKELEAALRYWDEAFKTGRSEPLYIARDNGLRALGASHDD